MALLAATFSLSLPMPLLIALGCWLLVPIVIAIGNRVQQEWMLGVWVLSVFAAVIATLVALGGLLVGLL